WKDVLLSWDGGKAMFCGPMGGGRLTARLPGVSSESREYPPCRERDGRYWPCISWMRASAIRVSSSPERRPASFAKPRRRHSSSVRTRGGSARVTTMGTTHSANARTAAKLTLKGLLAFASDEGDERVL